MCPLSRELKTGLGFCGILESKHHLIPTSATVAAFFA